MAAGDVRPDDEAAQEVRKSTFSINGAQAFADVRSYIQTAAAHGENRLEVLRQLFTDGPWLPPPRAAGGT